MGYAVAFAIAFQLVNVAVSAAELPRLKDVYKNDFVIGTCISNAQLDGKEPARLSLAAEQFSSITPENCLKWLLVHPEPDKYDFERADKYVEFGEKNHMFIVGHNFVWHNQTPNWIFEDKDGKPADRETVLTRLKEHIETVMGRYKGRIKGWDVVNEAIDDNGHMRQTMWMKTVGADYIEKAFEYAHETDPDAELYYNDFKLYVPAKRKAAIALVKRLKAKGLRVDAIGEQVHWDLKYPSIADAETTINELAADTGKMMITEMDIDVLPAPNSELAGNAEISRTYESRKEYDPYSKGLTAEVQQKLADRYAELFQLFLKHRDVIKRVTLWGTDDGTSWLNTWPVTKRTSYPLLFDRELKPKPAFEAVINVGKQN
ncbi:MAG TPA: endo-1,4-beta-xylanase [Lacipirellulaceae bacterium]|jgi:endo-1,4-beta-xylanase